MKKINLLIVFLLVVSTILAGCGERTVVTEEPDEAVSEDVEEVAEPPPSGEEPSPDDRVGGTLVWAIPDEPYSLNPLEAFDDIGGIMSLIGASPIRIGPDGKLASYLAESWSISDDGLTVDFKLKQGITFHDGTPFNAEAYAWSLKRMSDPEEGSLLAAIFLGPLVNIEAVDEYTLRLSLAEPYAPLVPMFMFSGYFQPLPQETLETLGEDFAREPVGVGPYMIDEWVTGEKIVLKRNPDFTWGPAYTTGGPPNIEKIEFRIIPETSTILAGLEAGEIDAALVESKEVARLEETGQFEFYSRLVQGMRPFLALNTSVAPFDDLNVRKAFYMAIDREALVKVMAPGHAEPQWGPLTSAHPGYWQGIEEAAYKFNLDEAKTLMEKAGYTMGDNGLLEKNGEPLALTLRAYGTEMWGKVASLLKEQFLELGVELEIQQDEMGVLDTDLFGTGNYVMALGGISSPEPDLLYILYHSSFVGVYNYGRVADSELDGLLEATRGATSQEERMQLFVDVQKYILEHVYAVPLYAPEEIIAVNVRVKDEKHIPMAPIFFVDILDAYIDDSE